jgi:hypothetical protein
MMLLFKSRSDGSTRHLLARMPTRFREMSRLFKNSVVDYRSDSNVRSAHMQDHPCRDTCQRQGARQRHGVAVRASSKVA